MSTTRSLKFRILTVFFVASLSSIFVAALEFYFANKVIQKYDSVVNENVPNLVQFIRMNAAEARMVIPIAQLVGLNTSSFEAQIAKDEFERALAEFKRASRDYEALPFSPGEQALWTKFKQEDLKRFLDLSYKMIELSGSPSPADHLLRDRLWNADYNRSRLALVQMFDKIVNIEVIDSQNKSLTATNLEKAKNQWTLLIVIAGLFITLTAGYFIANSLSKSSHPL